MKIKRYPILILLGLLFTTQLHAQTELNLFGGSDTESEPALTMIDFEETSHDFGKIHQGDTVRHVFRFKNIGDHPLLIENVKPSCTCTVLDFPQEAISPGGTGEIKAHIDTSDKSGRHTKYFAVIYNGNPHVERVELKFEIIENPEQ